MLRAIDIDDVAHLRSSVRTGALAAAVVATIVLLPAPYVAVPMFYATYRMNRGAVWAGVMNLGLTALVSMFFLWVMVSERATIVSGGSGETALFLTLFVVLALAPVLLVARALRRLVDLRRRFPAGEVWPDRPGAARTPWRGRTVSWMLIGIVTALAFAVFVVLAYWAGFELLSGWKEGLLALTLIPVLYGVVKQFRRIQLWTRRHMAASVAEVRAADTRAPVLFLRSFKDDELKLPPVARFNVWTVFEAHKTDKGHDFTLEEAIAEVLQEYGPVIALSQPGQPLPPLGAARENISGDHWQEVIDRYLVEARWIVAIIATSAGLRWEFERIIEGGAVGKLLLVFPPVDEGQITARWRVVHSLFAGLASGAELEDPAIARTLVMWATDDPPCIRLYTGAERTQNSLDVAMRMALAESG